MGNIQLNQDLMDANKELEELRLLEELQASEEFYTPFYWIEVSDGYGKLTTQAEEVALKYLKQTGDSLLFRKVDVQDLFKGWGMIVF